MITLKKGSIFDSGADILVNAVNPIGSMGGGIARKFALRYPDMENLSGPFYWMFLYEDMLPLPPIGEQE